MNFLAHSLLGRLDSEFLTGNLVADFVKGSAIRLLPHRTQEGVQYHRLTDFITDHHPSVLDSIARLKLIRPRIGAVVIDVIYDYLLATEWERFDSLTLHAHCELVGGMLADQTSQCPPEFQPLARWVVKGGLADYATHTGLERALRRIEQRVPYDVSSLMSVIRTEEEGLRGDLRVFFPALRAELARLAPDGRITPQGP